MPILTHSSNKELLLPEKRLSWTINQPSPKTLKSKSTSFLLQYLFQMITFNHSYFERIVSSALSAIFYNPSRFFIFFWKHALEIPNILML